MQQPIRNLRSDNIDKLISDFAQEALDIGRTISGLVGIPLLKALKRDKIGHGPYPDVTLFEAANRIMTDLVILHGVRGLLCSDKLPFNEYVVEFGHENKNSHDIWASSGDCTLAGEAFNVAPSFFHIKKSSAARKLRASAATYKILMFNSDAASTSYSARHEPGIFHVSVDIDASSIAMKPGLDPAR